MGTNTGAYSSLVDVKKAKYISQAETGFYCLSKHAIPKRGMDSLIKNDLL